jgi:hypothetical protein
MTMPAFIFGWCLSCTHAHTRRELFHGTDDAAPARAHHRTSCFAA